jgi:hypothetical protein
MNSRGETVDFTVKRRLKPLKEIELARGGFLWTSFENPLKNGYTFCGMELERKKKFSRDESPFYCQHLSPKGNHRSYLHTARSVGMRMQ